MKKTVRYQCEICENFFETEEMATDCEKKDNEKICADEGQMVKVKTEYGAERTGRVVKIETAGQEKNYTIGIYPQRNGLHFDYEYTFVLNGNKEIAERIVKVYENLPLKHPGN